MNVFLRKLHRWLGFPLGLLFLITFATGFLTAIDELITRQHHSDYAYRKTTTEEDAQILAVITQAHGEIRQVVMPTKSTPYYQAVLRGERYTYSIDNPSEPVYEKDEEGGFFKTALQLHRNYLLGKEGLWGIEGKYYSAGIALLALLISLIGLWLWWPARKNFQMSKMLPHSTQRKELYQSHMVSGVIIFIAIALLALTGASITYRSITQQIFGVERESKTPSTRVTVDDGWHAWLSAAYVSMPEGSELTSIRFPRSSLNTTDQDKKPNHVPQLIEFRFLTSGDWFGLSNSKALIDQKESALINVSVFKDLPLGVKLYMILKPLHTGSGLHIGYVVLQLILSLIGTIMVLSGVSSFAIKKRRWQWLKPHRWLRFIRSEVKT